MFRAAKWLTISNKEAPLVFTGTTDRSNSTGVASRNLDRGQLMFGLHAPIASVDHLHRAHAISGLQSLTGAVTFPATRPPNSRAWPPGFIASTEGRKDD